MRLIDADEVKKLFNPDACISTDTYADKVCVRELIDAIPTIEAEPIRHGKWDDKMVAFYRVCSECGAVIRQNTNEIFLHSCMVKVGRLNYCPNCGAKMDTNDTYSTGHNERDTEVTE